MPDLTEEEVRRYMPPILYFHSLSPLPQYTSGTSPLWLALIDSFSAGSRMLKEAIDALGEEDRAVLMDVVTEQY
jgi:hypothetical protein